MASIRELSVNTIKSIGLYPLIRPPYRKIKYSLINSCKRIRSVLSTGKLPFVKTWQEIPVIINNRNRLTFPSQLVTWLEQIGMQNIYFLDNVSTYPPLLEYYEETRHTVLQLDRNIGHTALWESNYYHIFKHDYYIYSDPDVVPDENCPTDLIQKLWKNLKKYYWVEKIGPNLRIDDLPDHYQSKVQTIDFEKRYFAKKISDDIYDAPVDTTFALYRPYTSYTNSGLRLANYAFRHLPWYVDYDNLSEEEAYYIYHANVSSTLGQRFKNKVVPSRPNRHFLQNPKIFRKSKASPIVS